MSADDGDARRVAVERHWEVALGGMRYGQDHAPEAPIWALSPDYSAADVAAAGQGEGVSVMAILPQLATLDFRSVVDYQCPLFFFAGADDRTTPRSVVEAFFATLHAPQKRLFVIDHAAHYVVDEAPGLVLLDLVEYVRPFAKGSIR